MEPLSDVQQKFILHWGEMGSRWGINRTMAQIHALLYVSPSPLPAEDITTALKVARSNVSTCLRDLQSWGIVRRVHVIGDRRDHFESLEDVWEMFRLIVAERKRRECDPTVVLLKECVTAARKAGKAEAHTAERLSNLTDFFEVTSAWYSELDRLPTSGLRKFMKLGGKVRKALGFGAGR